jgi:hypothetical protein
MKRRIKFKEEVTPMADAMAARVAGADEAIEAEKSTPAPTPKREERSDLEPLQLLLPYQRRWVEDGAKFKIGVQSRQTENPFARRVKRWPMPWKTKERNGSA